MWSWWKPALLLTLLFPLWSIPLPSPWQAISMPLSFLPLCQHESLYSWTMTQSGELIQLKINSFFFSGCVTSTLSQIWFTAWPQENLFQQKERLSKKKETSTTTLEVLDFSNWQWSHGAVKVKATHSYKTTCCMVSGWLLQVSLPNFSLFRLYVLQSKMFCLVCTHVINS